MTQKQLYILGAVLAVLVIAVAAFFLRSPDGATSLGGLPPDSILATDRTMGSPTAKVTLIEYGALTCSHCAAFNESILPLLKEKYIDTGKVRYVFRLFPLHQSDAWGEKIARCLPADNYFQFVDLLFRNQSKWVSDQPEGLFQMSRIAGMGAEKAAQCINDTTEDLRINKVAEDGMARYKITGTPTLVVNGVSQGANVPSWENMQKIIDDALAK